MSNFASYRHKSYDSGLNNASSRRDIDRDQASLLENWDISVHGRLKSRKGLTQVGNTLANAAKSLGVLRTKAGVNSLLLNEGTDVRYLNGSTWTDVDTLTANERISFANVLVNDKIYYSSENNGLRSCNSSYTTASVASSIAGNVIMWYQNHLWHINNVNVSATKYSNRIYWSDFGDPEAYTTASSFIELPGESRAVTMNVLGNNLVAFKEDSYMFIQGYGSSSWALTSSSTSIANTDASVGCVAPRGTVRVGANELWFMDNQGFVRKITQADYGFTSTVMSNNLDLSKITINGVVTGIDLSKLNNTIAWYDDDKVYFAVTATGSTVNNVVLVYDRKAASRAKGESWTVYTGWTINAATTYSSGVSPTTYIADNTNKMIFSHTGGSDNGVAINCRWDGKNDDYDQPERYKKFAYGYINSQAQSNEDITIWSSIDGTSFSKIGTFNLATDGTALGPTGPATMGPTGTFILGGSDDLQKKYYYSDGGGSITGKTSITSIRCSVDSIVYVDTFTSHFQLRSLK